jgi:hypothetical protein
VRRDYHGDRKRYIPYNGILVFFCISRSALPSFKSIYSEFLGSEFILDKMLKTKKYNYSSVGIKHKIIYFLTSPKYYCQNVCFE